MENAPLMDLNTAVAIATEDPTPQLRQAPQLNFTLPGGFLDDDGRVHHDVVVRELTGADEEALEAPLKSSKKTNPYEMIEQTIMRATERVGNITDITEEVARRLLIGDRDYLVLAIRRATYGDYLEGIVRCPVCGNDSDAVVDLRDDKDIAIKRLPEGNKRTFTVPLRNGSAEVRLATGDDQWALGEDLTRTLAEMNSIMLSRCVISINGVSLYDHVDPPLDQVRQLGAADRKTLLTFLADNQPGPNLRGVKVPCATCRVDIDSPIDMATLLRG